MTYLCFPGASFAREFANSLPNIPLRGDTGPSAFYKSCLTLFTAKNKLVFGSGEF